jgi:hypothetical protein
MSRSSLVAVGALALLVVAVAAWALPAQAPKEAPRPEVLSDKPVLVLTGQEGGAHLERAQLRSLGGRHFIVGKEVKDSPYVRSRFDGATMWIPLEDVKQLVELNKPGGGQ